MESNAADQQRSTELFLTGTEERLEAVAQLDHRGADQLINIVIKFVSIHIALKLSKTKQI